jgi:hypothetical protein
MNKLHGIKNNDDSEKGSFQVRFQVLMAVGMKMTVFWVVVPCSLAEIY